MQDITVKEFKQKKIDLEEAILDLLVKFTDETKHAVTSLDVMSDSFYSLGLHSNKVGYHRVKVNCELLD